MTARINPAATPQPAPRPGKREVLPMVLIDIDSIVQRRQRQGKGWRPELGALAGDLRARYVEGLKKYGTPLMTGNGRDALWDAYQEALDLVMYLRQAASERREAGLYPEALKIAIRLRRELTERDAG
ncbi:MAG: hypothetical protein ACU85V_20425 [Gammaproteobacteria bacterium]